MSADKRSVHTDALATLGKIIDEGAGRDAIHVAVEPVMAGEKLYPGQDIGIVNGKAFKSVDLVGIVDPFLKNTVMPGEWFWLLVYPRTITSLRHVWSHPAFTDKESKENINVMPDKAVSEAWLRSFCENNDCPAYDTVMRAIEGRDEQSYFDEEYLHFDGLDAHGEIPDEFWDHVEIVTGKRITMRSKWFSCSC